MRAYGERPGDWATRDSRRWSGRSSRGEPSPHGRMSLSEWKRLKRQPKRRERQEARRALRHDALSLGSGGTT